MLTETMKWILIIALSIPSFAFAQSGKRDVLNPDQLGIKEFKLEAQKTAPSEIELPFKSIKIIDSRYDTSKFGYMLEGGLSKKRMFRKMLLSGGVANAIESYYNDYYEGSFTQNDFELLIVMKRFWLAGNVRSNTKRVETANSVGGTDNLYCKWEYYLGKDGKYLPVKRMDTIMRVDEDLARYIGEEFSEKRLSYFKYVLKALIEILDYSNAVKQFNTQPNKTLVEIKEFNKKMNLIPVLQDTCFKKGVYLSFEDFKNNQPSIIDFQKKKMRYGTINTEVYLENMKGETISNYWGYSDGKEFRYGMLGNDKIYRVQNTFCFFIKVVGYYINQGNNNAYDRLFEDGVTTNNTLSKEKYEIWVPFQIDMETGEIY